MARRRDSKANRKSGAKGGNGAVKWRFYQSMSFLEPTLKSRKTTTNLLLEEDADGDNNGDDGNGVEIEREAVNQKMPETDEERFQS